MRTALLASLALLAVAGAARAATVEETVYLHDAAGLHLVPAVIYAQEGDDVVLHVRNDGLAVHNLTVCGDPTTPLARCSDVWARTADLPANASETLRFRAERAGTFDYYWARGDTKGSAPGAAGAMWGTLVVSEKQGVPAAPAALGALLVGAAALLGRRA